MKYKIFPLCYFILLTGILSCRKDTSPNKNAGLIQPANNTFVFGFIQDNVDPFLGGIDYDYTNAAANHFKGLLDDVAIYHSVLTPALITLMYNSGL